MLWLGGCASAAARREKAARSSANAAANDTTIVVQVHSDYASAVKVWYVKDRLETLLGEVRAGRDELYRLSPASVGRDGLALLVVPLVGHERATTRVVKVSPGQIASLQIASDLLKTQIVVRWGPRCWTCADPFKPARSP